MLEISAEDVLESYAVYAIKRWFGISSTPFGDFVMRRHWQIQAIHIMFVTALLLGLNTPSLAGVFLFSATDTPLAVPPVGTTGTTISTIVVPGGSGFGAIQDINVFVNLDHTFTGDLDIFLENPGTATSVHLFDSFGSGGDNIRNVTFDDEAGSLISSVVAPFGPGSFRPDPGSLSAFDGQILSGATFQLRIVDNFSGDSGTLFDFTISGEAATVPEPTSFTLWSATGLGLVAYGWQRKRKQRQQAIV